jgi:hypothetical protein
MAKVSGITTSVTVDDADGSARIITNDVTSLTTNTSRGVQDVTGLDKSAMERLLLLSDGTITINGVFNTAALTGSHTVLSTITDNDTRTVAIGYPGATLTMEMLAHTYNLSRAQDGSLTFTAELSLADGAVPAWT